MSEKAKITGLKVSNFKRVKLIEIQPEQNGLTILGGNNRQGKSSILDAIAYALGGESFRPSTINNTEADDNATIRVEIDGLIVERKGKNADLKTTDARGMKGNQTLLNEIVSKFALDLGSFLNASEPDKAKMLLKMFPELETQLDALNLNAEKIREERADVNRDIKRLQAQISGSAIIQNIPDEEISVQALTDRLHGISESENELDENRRQLANVEQARAKAEAGIASLNEKKKSFVQEFDSMNANEQREFESLKQEFQRREEEIRARYQKRREDLTAENSTTGQSIELLAQAISESDDRIKKLNEIIVAAPNCAAMKKEVLSEIQHADEINSQIRKNKEYRNILAELEEARQKSDAFTQAIDEIGNARVEILKKANLPLPELAIDEESKLQYNGQKWDCMSGAERLKVATAICMGTKPECGFVLIDGLEAMDTDTLAEFSQFLAEMGMQGIGTIVGDERATVVIEDGMIKESESK